MNCSVRPMPPRSVSTRRCAPTSAAKMAMKRRLALFAQTLRPLLDHGAIELRHARGGRAGPRRKREDVQLRQTAFVDQIERAGEHVFGLGRETGNDVGAENNIGPQGAHALAEVDGILTRMPPLHALENEIVTGLQ